MAPEVRTQLFSTFMHTFFSRNTKTNSKDDTLYFLMAHFPILAGESELIDRSVIALVSAVLAKKANDSLLTRQGLEIYNSALDVMSCSLRRKAPPTSNMLYATILFHTYETMYDNADALRKCFLHVQGASALIKHHDFKRDDTRALTEAMLNRQKWAASFFVLNTNFESTADWECLALKQDDSPMDELFRFIAQYALIQRHFLDLSFKGGFKRSGFAGQAARSTANLLHSATIKSSTTQGCGLWTPS
ncbi:hypothetical protein N7454_001596 [Penicillium verhagenii]|nr:hypothetical protein N7454_001596 [Penicillium verhagenii]